MFFLLPFSLGHIFLLRSARSSSSYFIHRKNLDLLDCVRFQLDLNTPPTIMLCDTLLVVTRSARVLSRTRSASYSTFYSFWKWNPWEACQKLWVLLYRNDFGSRLTQQHIAYVGNFDVPTTVRRFQCADLKHLKNIRINPELVLVLR